MVLTVRTADDAAVRRVNVLFTTAADGGVWRSVDLALDGETFTGSAPVAPGTTEVDYFVQVVDSGGNVSVSADKGANFVATADLTPPPGASAPAIILPPTDTPGQYTGDVEVTIAPGTAGGPVDTRVDGGAPSTAGSIVVSGNGLHEVEAIGPDAAVSLVTFYIGDIVPPTPPTVEATTAPVPPSGWFTTKPVTVEVTGTAGSSPVASVRYRVGGTGEFTEVDGETASVGVSAEGLSTVEYAAIDSNGLESPVGTLDVRVDSVKPVVTVTAPAAGATYTVGQVVNAAYTCDRRRVRARARRAGASGRGGRAADRHLVGGTEDLHRVVRRRRGQRPGGDGDVHGRRPGAGLHPGTWQLVHRHTRWWAGLRGDARVGSGASPGKPARARRRAR